MAHYSTFVLLAPRPERQKERKVRTIPLRSWMTFLKGAHVSGATMVPLSAASFAAPERPAIGKDGAGRVSKSGRPLYALGQAVRQNITMAMDAFEANIVADGLASMEEHAEATAALEAAIAEVAPTIAARDAEVVKAALAAFAAQTEEITLEELTAPREKVAA